MEQDLNKAVIQGQASLQGPSQAQVSSKEVAQHNALDSVQGAQSTEAPKAPHKDSSALNGGAVVNSEQAPLAKSAAEIAPAAKAKAAVGTEAMAAAEARAVASTDHAAVTSDAASAAAPALDHSARSPSSAQSATTDPQATAAAVAAATTTKTKTKAQTDHTKTLEPATTNVTPAPLAAANTKTQVETETAPLASTQTQKLVPTHKKHKGELAESLSDELKTLNADLHSSAAALDNLKPKRGVASAYLASLNQSPLQQGARDARTVSKSQVAKLNSPSLKKLNQAMQTGSWEHRDSETVPTPAPVPTRVPVTANAATFQHPVGAVETPVHFAIPDDSLFESLCGAGHSQDKAAAKSGAGSTNSDDYHSAENAAVSHKEPSAVEIFRNMRPNKVGLAEQIEPYSPYRSMEDISPQDSPMDIPTKPAWAENIPPHQVSEPTNPQTHLPPQMEAFASEALQATDMSTVVPPNNAHSEQYNSNAHGTPSSLVAPNAHFAPGVNYGALPLGNSPAGLMSEARQQPASAHNTKLAPNDAPAISLTPTPSLLEVMDEAALSSLHQATPHAHSTSQSVFTSSVESIADANVNSARTSSLGMGMPETVTQDGQPLTSGLDMSDVAGHDVSGVMREMHGTGTTLLARASFAQPAPTAPAVADSALSVNTSAMSTPASNLGALSSVGMSEASGVLSAALASQGGIAGGVTCGIASGMEGVSAPTGMMAGHSMAGVAPSHMPDRLGSAAMGQPTEADLRQHTVCKGGVFSNGLVQDIAPASDLYFNNGNRIIRKAVIVSKVYHRPVGGAIVEVAKLLNNLGVESYTDQSTAIGFNIDGVPVLSRRGMKETDLIIVVGGDGSVLGASRSLVDLQVPVLGINRGHLGLLTDISPNNIEDALSKVVSGNYTTENRMMIDVRVMRRDEEGSEEMIGQSLALNETVIHSGILAHMIVCRVTINGRYMYTLRSDGIIVGTPTGSTAYSLSAGGPIIEPHLDVLCLVPMFPQSLNCSPIILPGKSCVEIEFEVKDSMPEWVNVNCDGQVTIRADTKCVVNIRQHPNQLQLIHPAGYDYYSVLRQKLGWGQSLV